MSFLSIKKTALALALVAGGAAAGGGAAFAAYQGHMYSAVSDLRAASYQLHAAAADKAGHRAQAINLVNQAIYQAQLGIRAGNM